MTAAMNLSTTIKFFILPCIALTLVGCIDSLFIGSVNGGNSHSPYYITTQPTLVKKLLVPQGTKLTYEGISSTYGQQDQIMREDKLTEISLPETATIEWAGVPVRNIIKYFNTDTGVTLRADFSQLDHNKKSRLSKMLLSCNDNLSVDVQELDFHIEVRDLNDWSFNKNNITDVSMCSGQYQRFFKQDLKQQKFLDDLLIEMKKL